MLPYLFLINGGDFVSREIKFRAWVTDYDPDHDNHYKMIQFNVFNNMEQSLHDENDSVIMQYTGLKDKNGVEIYEGDIVSFTTELYIDGVYVEREYVEYVTHEYGAFCLDGLLLGDLSNIDEEIEVIGNIYENPELLEATK